MLSFEFTYTKVPNVILDYFMQGLTGAELTIMIFICRKTLGFQKKVDRIAYSTFVEGTGLTKPTVAMALKKLVKKKMIIKNGSTTPHSYSLNDESIQFFEKLRLPVKYSSSCKAIKPTVVKNSNPIVVKELNTQKKALNKKKETTTSSRILNDDVLKIIEEWNIRFSQKIELEDLKMIKDIENVLESFSVDQLISSIENRLNADYYKNEKPYLLNNPNCFFPYPETIRTDMMRKSKRLFTYNEMLDLVFIKGYKESEFEIRKDKKDNDGNPLRELKRR